jgi:hypothetical protein
MYLEKIVETDPYLVSKKGTVERTVRIIGEGQDLSHEKLASAALEFSNSVQSKPGSTYILVLAMGASEYYGPNRNGDAFKESELIKHHKTFETNAHVFKSHVNKDPVKNIGLVTKSFYNHDMHRVELILELHNSKCPEIISKIRDNQDVAVSMGCRIKYDVCTICGNKAPTRADYCKHLKYEMNEIYPDGRIVAADNPSPNFFDISVVWRPADKTGYMLKKVANFGIRERGDSSTAISLKIAALDRVSKYLSKAAEIDKIITGTGINPDSIVSEDEKSLSIKWLKSLAPSMVGSNNRLPDDTVKSLATEPLPAVLKSLSDKNIVLMTPEFLDLIFMKLLGTTAPDGLASKICKLQGSLFETLARNPEEAAKVVEEGCVNPEVIADGSLERKIASIDRSTEYVKTYERPHSLSESTIKVAGVAAKVYTVYLASHLLNTEPSLTKISHIVNPDSTENCLPTCKMSYLTARTTDIVTNNLNTGEFSTIKISRHNKQLPLEDYQLGSLIFFS